MLPDIQRAVAGERQPFRVAHVVSRPNAWEHTDSEMLR